MKSAKELSSGPEKELGEEPVVTPSQKQQYEEKKVTEKKIRKITNRIKSLEHEIEEIEKELARMDEMLMDPQHITGMQVYDVILGKANPAARKGKGKRLGSKDLIQKS